MWLERYGLIEVDLMPTLEGEITPILGTRTPLWLISGWEHKHFWLGFKHKSRRRD